MMDPIPLNDVRAAAADVAADTTGTAVADPVANIAGTAANALAALAGAATDTAVTAADARAAIASAAAGTVVAAADIAVAATDSAGDLYRCTCHVRRHCGFHVPHSTRSGRHLCL